MQCGPVYCEHWAAQDGQRANIEVQTTVNQLPHIYTMAGAEEQICATQCMRQAGWYRQKLNMKLEIFYILLFPSWKAIVCVATILHPPPTPVNSPTTPHQPEKLEHQTHNPSIGVRIDMVRSDKVLGEVKDDQNKENPRNIRFEDEEEPFKIYE